MLASVYSEFMGPWNMSYEAQYRALSEQMQSLDSAEMGKDLLQKLQFARLCAFLRHRQYQDQVGYSILIYRVSDEEVHRALYGEPVESRPRPEIRGLP